MKFSINVVLVIIFLIAAPFISAQDNAGEVLFQEAIYHIEGTGDYAEAISILNQIVDEHADNEELASQSLLQLGMAYEKLGMQEARRTYERIIDEFNDQQEIVLEARSRLINIEDRIREDSIDDITVRQVWEGENVDVLGQVSSDGQYLSFVDWATGDLAIRNLSTYEHQRLTDKGTWTQSREFAMFSIFSPDGSQIAYSWWNDEDFIFELHIVETESREMNILFSESDVSYLQPLEWLPNNQSVVSLIVYTDGSSDLALISLKGEDITILKTNEWQFTHNTAVSPDGRFLAFDYNPYDNDGQRDIYVYDLETQQENTLVSDRSANMTLGWTPNGKHLLFSSDRAGMMGIWKLPVFDGKPAGEPVFLKSDIGQTIFPMGLTERGDLVYGKTVGGRDVFTSSFDPETYTLTDIPAKISHTYVGLNRAPDWSPDGRYVAYSTTRNLQRINVSNSIVIHNIETGHEHVLRPELNFISDRIRWSPDGESVLVFGANIKHETGLFLINSKTGEIETAIYSGEQERLHRPDFSPEGRYLYYFRNDFSAYQASLIQHDLQNGNQTVLYRTERPEFLGHIAISVDGSKVAFRKGGDGESSLLVASVESNKVTELVTYSDNSIVNDIYDFIGDHVVYRKEIEKPGEAQKAENWKVNVLTGEKEKFKLFDDLDNISNFRFHPNKNKVVFNMGPHQNRTIWKIENLLTGLNEE